MAAALNRAVAKQNRGNPTPEMLTSREYFAANKARADEVASRLLDDASRDCYYKMLDFRCNSAAENFPDSDPTATYFWNEHFTEWKDEVLVDCGAYIGDSITQFKKAVKTHGGSYRKIIAFEPDAENYAILTKTHKDVIAYKSGVWSKDDTLTFNEGNGLLSGVVAWGNVSVDVKSIDSCRECNDATFIKMDIEGSEMEALEGARNTISANKPRLAISIYHSNEDMIRLAEWIYGNFPEYSLFVRQHRKYSIVETVLYAFVPRPNTAKS